MAEWEYASAWYHGSPEQLKYLRQGSALTQHRALAAAFSHKPSVISASDDPNSIKHNGVIPGFLYVVAEQVGPDDVAVLPGTDNTHWIMVRDLELRFVEELPVDEPAQLTEEEATRLRLSVPAILEHVA